MILASETDRVWSRGYVSGSFDMFHIGHLNLLRNAKERSNWLIAGVLDDAVIEKMKGKKPVIPLNDRLEIVRAIVYVDEVDVTTFELIPKVAAWERYRFDAMFSGDDHANSKWAWDEKELNALGAELVFFPYTKEISTTMLRDMLK